MRGFFVLFLILTSLIMIAQTTAEFEDNLQCFDDEAPGSGKVSFDYTREGGLYLTSDGTIKVLILWVEFKDDGYDTDNANWEAGEEPEFMGNIIDPSWDGTPTAGTLTDYFNKASFGKLKLIGDEKHLITNLTRAQYRANGDRRDDIHRELIQKIDSTISFSPYDNWTYNGAGGSPRHLNSSDNIVEMIMFVWRNVALDIPLPEDRRLMKLYLNLDNFGSITGNTSDISVDGGTRTIKTFDPRTSGTTGSGVTIIDALGIDYKGKMIHEFAHYLLGSNAMHIGYASWGMLDDWGARSNCPAAYERLLLGWVPETANTWNISTTTQTTSELTLRDYMKTGDYIRIDIDPTNDEYFYLENHQREYSTWDNPDKLNTSVKGLYITHQREEYPSKLLTSNRWIPKFFLCPADGRYDYHVSELSDNQWGDGQLPVWEYNGPDADGYHDCDRISWSFGGASGDYSPIIYWYDNYEEEVVLDNPKLNGDGKDQFDESNRIFSSWALMNSNDKDQNSTGITVEVVDVETDGDIRVKIYVNTGINARPSKSYVYPIEEESGHPKITWHSNGESDINTYWVFRSTSYSGTYSYVTSTNSSTTTYTDTGAPDAPSTGYLYYYIMNMDNTYKVSNSSEIRKLDVVPSVPGNYQLTEDIRSPTLSKPKLTWNVNTEADIAGYNIYRKLDGESSFSVIETLSSTTSSYIDMEVNIRNFGNNKTAYYYVEVFDDDTEDVSLTNVTVTKSIDYGIEFDRGDDQNLARINEIPKEYGLSGNYPNPFNPTTRIKFALPEAGKVKITIYNIQGKVISSIANREYPAGYHEVSFDASGLSSGFYFYKIEVNGYISVKKMQVIK